MFYLVCILFRDGDGYMQETPLKLFGSYLKAIDFCVTNYIKQMSSYVGNNDNVPDIYIQKLKRVKENPRDFVEREIINADINYHLDDITIGEYIIRRIEIE